jgi:quinohemoprotein ethanol dehydrogenase
VAAIAKTWKGDSWQLAGANVWDAMTYDPVTDLLYISTSSAGEAAGDFSHIKPSGNLLFANSIIAVNASTGQYVWHYQTAYPPSGAEDFHILVANLNIRGTQRRVVMTVPRNGVFYTLDARTGTEVVPPRGIGGTAYPSLKQIDLRTLSSKGYQDAGRPKTPDTGYGHGWFPMGYNPQTGLVYISAYETKAGGFGFGEAAGLGGSAKGGSGQYADYDPVAHGKLVAFDPIKQEPRWVVTLPVEINGGVLTTAGNLVFHGGAGGVFAAYAADSGKELWSVKTGSAMQSVPVTYVINGEQYVLTPIGMGGGYRLFGRASDTSTLDTKRGPARLLAFKLGGNAAMPPIHADIPPVPLPPEQPGTMQQIAEGARIYNEFYCQKCHSPQADGSGAWVLDGEVPDLRYMPRDVHDQFMAVVLGGTHREQGMPNFSVPPGWPWIKSAITAEQAQALHDYIIDLEWRAYKLGPRGVKSADSRQ